MRSSAALPILAIAGMMLATPAPGAGGLLVLPMCFGGVHSARLPQKNDGAPANCPGACHAMCCRSRNGPDLDDGDQEA